jgi:CRP/FNR family transcriptional regulator, cyclic AMP receptor protein
MTNARILEMIDIFNGLNSKQLEKVYQICTEILCTKGTTIVKENTPSTEIYLILDGEVEILVGGGGITGDQVRRIGGLERGQSFGEIALVDQGLRSATVRCATDTCRLLEISRNELFALLRVDTDIGFIVMFNLAADLCIKFRQATYKL